MKLQLRKKASFKKTNKLRIIRHVLFHHSIAALSTVDAPYLYGIFQTKYTTPDGVMATFLILPPEHRETFKSTPSRRF